MTYTTPYVVRMLAQVEYAQLGFQSNGDYEDFIQHYLIPQADSRIDQYCNHSFGTPTIGTFSLDGSGKSVLFLPTERCPLLGITAGSCDSTAIPVTALKVHEQYVEWDGGVFSQGKLNVTLAGSYGYTSRPADIESASAQICANMLIELVRKKVLPDLFKNTESGALVSSSKAFTSEIKDMLNPYVLKYVDIG